MQTGKHLSYSDAEDDEMSFVPEDLNSRSANNFSRVGRAAE
jgi:hypothetical protein